MDEIVLKTDEYFFEIDSNTNIVQGYHDYQPNPEFTPEGVKFVVSKAILPPESYVGIESRYLGTAKVPSNLIDLTAIQKARNKAKVAFIELLFSSDVGEPDLINIELNYSNLKAEYIALRDEGVIQ